MRRDWLSRPAVVASRLFGGAAIQSHTASFCRVALDCFGFGERQTQRALV
jgi:hypothetical protein